MIHKSTLGSVTLLGRPRSVSKNDVECRFLESWDEMAKWPWRLRSMTPVLNISQENLKVHIWCKFCDSSSSPLQVILDVFFDLCLNESLNKQSRRGWFKTPSRSVWRQSYVNRKPQCRRFIKRLKPEMLSYPYVWWYRSIFILVLDFCMQFYAIYILTQCFITSKSPTLSKALVSKYDILNSHDIRSILSLGTQVEGILFLRSATNDTFCHRHTRFPMPIYIHPYMALVYACAFCWKATGSYRVHRWLSTRLQYLNY